MQDQRQPRRTSGAKAVAIDSRAILMRYRLLQLLALGFSGLLAIALRLVFGH